MKRLNWRHKWPEAPERKRVQARRVRMKPFGLTFIIRQQRRINSAIRQIKTEKP